MTLKTLELTGFKSFAKKTRLDFSSPVVSIVGPNGSGKSNIVEAIRFVLGEQSMKSLRGKGGGDLVFKGSKSLGASSRAIIKITFDNSKRLFSFAGRDDAPEVSFDEVVISREIEKDGGSTYRINETEVRLKDVIELLSSVHIGASGHHIISQGEADRILSANSRDRRAMIEDALGLKIFQYKIREAERKLEHTKENMKEVSALRRELAPHLTFLKKQVEKIEKAESLRAELHGLYIKYFATESYYLKNERERLSKSRRDLESEIEAKKKRLEALEVTRSGASAPESNNLSSLKDSLAALSSKRDALSRALGRVEGALEALTNASGTTGEMKSLALERVEPLIESVSREIEHLLMGESDVSVIRASLAKIRASLMASWNALKSPTAETKIDNRDLVQTQEAERVRIKGELAAIAEEERVINETINRETKYLANAEARIREEERGYYSALSEKNTKEAELGSLTLREEALSVRALDFENAQKEANALIGPDVLRYVVEENELSLDERRDLLRALERNKIKLEDIGGGGNDVLKEFEDTQTREEFLAKEYTDLDTAVKSLEVLINELKDTLETEFKKGVEKINEVFTNFFALMFGGGHATLSVVVENKRIRGASDEDEIETLGDEEVPLEKGIEINVSLPHKKVRDLAMLSGGERSLTSIALLFAMSQVNPPPFLVLDETDAALDEANSRRYGDMLENLAKYSQLIVVTHNRETMSRANILYGVTVGADGSSKLLSIKFDEAVKIAK